MSFPESLKQDFDVLDGSPTGIILPCYRVREMKHSGREFTLRLLPVSFWNDKGIVDAFHDFFTRFAEISNKSYIPQVHSVVGAVNGPVYVLEEFVSGVPLKEFTGKRKGSKDLFQEAINIIARVCEALHSAHQKDVFHLSVSPEDILVDENNPAKVKLVGFGAQLFATKGKIDYYSSESRKYIAPEVFKRGVFGPKADVYSLAVTIKELLPEFSEASDILDKATSVTLKDRFPSARQFAAKIKERGLSDPVAEPTPKVSKPTKAAKLKGGLQPILKVRTDPPGAIVIADGKVMGTTTSSGFAFPWSPGKAISFEKLGYETKTLSLDEPPENSTIEIKLNPALKLFTNPWGATIRINGDLVGTTTHNGLMIPWDKGEIEITKPGYEMKRLNFPVPPSEPHLVIELEPQSVPVSKSLQEQHTQSSYVEQPTTGSDVSLQTRLTEWASRVVDTMLTVWRRLRSSDLLGGKAKSIVVSLLIVGVLFGVIIIFDLSTKNQAPDSKKGVALMPSKSQQASPVKPAAQLSTKDGGHSPKTKPVNHNLDTELMRAASNGNSHDVSRLLTLGTNPNEKNSTGHTSLMLASYYGHLEIVRTLLNAGADKNLQSQVGLTALDLASQRKHSNIVTLLNTHTGGKPATPLPNHPPTITAGLGIAIEKLLPDVASKIMPGDRHGFVVKSVISDGIGAKIGLRPDDVIVEVDGTTFAYMVELDKLWVAATKKGVIRVKIVRGTTVIFLGGSLN